MEATELQKILVRMLANLGVRAHVALPIVLNLETEDQQLEMGMFLRPLLGTVVTEDRSLQKAIEITGG